MVNCNVMRMKRIGWNKYSWNEGQRSRQLFENGVKSNHEEEDYTYVRISMPYVYMSLCCDFCKIRCDVPDCKKHTVVNLMVGVT